MRLLRKFTAVILVFSLFADPMPTSGYNSDLLKAAIQYGRQYGIAPETLIATTLVESGGNLRAVGDGGTSYGPYQMHRGGRLGSYTPEQAYDPYLSTRLAAQEFAAFKRKGYSGGALAAAAQRPADPSGYAAKVNARIAEARRIMQGGGITGSTLNAPVSVAGQPSASGATGFNGQQLGLDALKNKREGESFTSAVRRQMLSGNYQTSAQATPANDAPPSAPASPQGAGAANDAAVALARSRLGTPYSWGGGTPGGPTKGFGRGANTVGFDCSSLVQYAWAAQGVKLPRTTYGQIKAGTAVQSLSQAKPGDLLFPHAGHVQMYIGNGKVIEAPYTGARVRITNVGSRYIAIRRPG